MHPILFLLYAHAFKPFYTISVSLILRLATRRLPGQYHNISASTYIREFFLKYIFSAIERYHTLVQRSAFCPRFFAFRGARLQPIAALVT